MNTASSINIAAFAPARGASFFIIALAVSRLLHGAEPAALILPPDPNDMGVLEAAPAPVSLKQIPIPSPSNIGDFIADYQSALVLGKSLFWDTQVGSDGVTACATCHFHAGADRRNLNTLAPALLRLGPDGSPQPDWKIDKGANAQLSAADFPFHRLANPKDRRSSVISTTDDIVGSQGVFKASYAQATPRRAEEIRPTSQDGIYHVSGVNTRRVAPRNTPSVINAVFYLRNFWDGRAQDVFNGVNSFGLRDPDARVLVAESPRKMAEEQVLLHYSSLASQAVAPPLSDVEMSAVGRSFADLGKKLLQLRPLARQKVHPEDSVLGGQRVHPTGKGLRIPSYLQLVQQAFRPKWWQGQAWVQRLADGRTQLIQPPNTPTTNQYNHPSWNFALFFGIALQVYQSTLVSDDAPFDRYAEGYQTALTPQQQRGFQLFNGKAKCISCHSGAEFSSATVSHIEKLQALPRIADPGEAAAVEVEGTQVERIESMVFASGQPVVDGSGFVNTTGRHVVYDNGFYNIGVRPTSDDLGIGSTDPFGLPLSEARLFYLGKLASLGLPAPAFSVSPHYTPSADGAFKTPSLRNVELTAPYFHNGGQLTLRQVLDFYDRGGDFRDLNIRDVPTDITALGLTHSEKEAIVAFMLSLTDPRVKYEQAPFDHPQLFVPNGHPTSGSGLQVDAQGQALTNYIEIPAVGRRGGAALPPFLAPRAP